MTSETLADPTKSAMAVDLLSDGCRYGEQGFWEDKYANNDSKLFDWYLDYTELRDLLHKHIPREADLKIMVVGCGNSPLAENMFLDGYAEYGPILSVDYSTSVIKQMQERADKYEMNLEYMCLDCRKMTVVPNQSFDVVLDKGTIDAMVCSESFEEDIAQMVAEAHRILKPGGLYMVISYGEPHMREFYFDKLKRSCAVTVESWQNPNMPPGDNTYYVYLIRKFLSLTTNQAS